MAMSFRPQQIPQQQIAQPSWGEVQTSTVHDTGAEVEEPTFELLEEQSALLAQHSGAVVDESTLDTLEEQSALLVQPSAAPVREPKQIEQNGVLNDESVQNPFEEQSALLAQHSGAVVDESTLAPIELTDFSQDELGETSVQDDLQSAQPQQIEQQPLEMLKTHNVEAWSQWRVEHPDIRPDFSGADLHGLDLREFDLSGVKLVGANLRGTDLSNATLVKTEFRGADLRKAKLIQANMTDADLSEAFLQNVDLTQAVSSKKTNLTEADLTEATLTGANLNGAILKKAIFTNATLSGANLIGADLTGAILISANLSECLLTRATLVDAIMAKADLSKAYLNFAFLQGVDLSNAKLVEANFRGADLSRAKLIKANMTNTDLSEAILQDVDLTQAVSKKTNLTEADLTEATLTGANLSGAILKKANFNRVSLSQTIFKNVDLRETKGLETVVHFEPSVIDIDTIDRSRSNISIEFLRQAGTPDIIIDSMFASADHPMKYQTCFISYSSKDEVFAKRLFSDLSRLGVHCVFAPESLESGELFNSSIVEYIQNSDKLLLILSKHSLKSTWVEEEAKIASQKQGVLLPFQIDKAVQTTDQSWAANIRDTYHIGDFTGWQQPHAYLLAIAHLLRDLKSDT